MLRRTRWFSFGLAAGVGGSAWLVTRLRKARERLTPAGVRRAMAIGLADTLDRGAQTVDPQSR